MFDSPEDSIAGEIGIDGGDVKGGSAEARLHGIEREDHGEPNGDCDTTCWTPE
jgi:hypothetical protein